MHTEKLVTLRSDFLVHWTGGRDIHKYYETLSDEHRNQYVERLRSILLEPTHGLWMKRNEDSIEVPGRYKIYYGDAPMTCFTEIKLSITRKHTEQYGCLGFGFSRDFVLKNSGAPVHYVAGTEEDIISGNLFILMNSIERDVNYERLYGLVKSIILFLKPMSNCKDPHDFAFLDESEWRILYLEQNNQENVTFLGKDNDPPAKITFGPDDLKVLVFPDPKTREMALNDDDIFGWFGRAFPTMATIEECLQF